MQHTKIAVLTAAGALAVPAAAQAHVTLQPKTAVAGAYTVLDVRVPNERDNASTVKVDVQFPDGFPAASYQPIAGWKVKVIRKKLAKPIQTDDGPITEGIDRMIWTGSKRTGLGKIGPGEFMDLPMRAYSSGMYGRLAFSVAIHMDPDILLIDEALSVGDAKFRRKSFERMRELCAEQRTIILVSHAFGSIRDLCHQAVWMNKGNMEMWGEANEVVDAYRDFLGVKEDRTDKEDL